MIQAFKIVNFMGEELYMELKKPWDTGFLITSVTGLTFPKTEIKTTNYSNFDGSSMGGLRVEERNIVMTIVFYRDNIENLDIEQLRWKLYRYFQPKKELTLYAINETGTFKINGYIESNEIDIFVSDEKAQISIICPDPYFVTDGEEISYSISTVDPLFEFPVTIESIEQDETCYLIESNGFGGKDLVINAIYDTELTEGTTGYTLITRMNNRTLEFGNIKNYPSTSIDYKGHGDTGVSIIIEALGTFDKLRINNVTRKESLIFDDDKLSKILGNNVQKNDIIQINTEKGKKSCKLVRDGVSYNILNAIKKESQWIYIQNGINVFTYSVGNEIEMAKVFVSYSTKYLGV